MSPEIALKILAMAVILFISIGFLIICLGQRGEKEKVKEEKGGCQNQIPSYREYNTSTSYGGFLSEGTYTSNYPDSTMASYPFLDRRYGRNK